MHELILEDAAHACGAFLIAYSSFFTSLLSFLGVVFQEFPMSVFRDYYWI